MNKPVHVWKAKWEKTGVPDEERDRNEAWDMAGRDPNYQPDEEAIEAAKEKKLAVEKAERVVKKAVKRAKRAARGEKPKKVAKKATKKTKK